MSNIVFGPFGVVQAPQQEIPNVIIERGRPFMRTSAGNDTDLWLPSGWFYEFAPEVPGKSHHCLTLWCAGGRPADVSAGVNAIRVAIPGFQQAAEVKVQPDVEIVVQTSAPSVFPDEALVFSKDPAKSDLPRVVCTPHWVPAVDLGRSQTTKSSRKGDQNETLLDCVTALPNGALVAATLVARVISTTDDDDLPPKLAVWPSFVRPDWRLHRLYADARICHPAKDATTDLFTSITLVAAEKTETVRSLRRMRSLDDTTDVAVSAHSEKGAPAVQSALLLAAPGNTDEIFWSIAETRAGTGATVRAAIFPAGVTAVAPTWGKKSIAGSTQIGLDLGTTTTTVSGYRSNAAFPFAITAEEAQWSVAWAGRSTNDHRFTNKHWLPWVSSRLTQKKDQTWFSYEQFPSAVRITASQPGHAPDVSATVRGTKVSSGLVRAVEDESPTLTGQETSLSAGSTYRSKPGGLKWDSLNNTGYSELREAYLEQLLTFVAHDIREQGAGGGSTHAILRATCPSRFSKNARENYAGALITVAERVRKYTGLEFEVGGRIPAATPRERAEAASATFRDESEPLLNQVIASALIGASSRPLVLVADLGGETLDLGLYAKLDTTTFAEIFSDSIRCGGHGALQAALPGASSNNKKLLETLSFAIRDYGAVALGFADNVPEYAKADFTMVFPSAEDREAAKAHFQTHAIANARAAASLLTEAAAQIEAIVASPAQGSFRFDQFQYASIEKKDIQSAGFLGEWTKFSAEQWTHLRPKLASLLRSSAAPQQTPVPAVSVANSAPTTLPADNRLAGLRQYLQVEIDVAKSMGRSPSVDPHVVLKMLDLAGATASSAAPAPTPSASNLAPPSGVAPETGSPELGCELIVYLAGNGWRLAEATGWPSGAELVQAVLELLGVPQCSVFAGSKVDSVVGLLQAQNTKVWRRYGEGRAARDQQSLAPHGVALASFSGNEPMVYDSAQPERFRELLNESLRKPSGDLFLGARELESIAARVEAGHDKTGVVASIAITLAAGQGTATRARILKLAKTRAAEVQGPAQKLMLEAFYSQDH